MDERYRVMQDVSSIQEALWHVAQTFGTKIDPDEQVAIARELRATLERRSGPLTRSDILGAFEKYEVPLRARGFARDVIARLERLDPRKGVSA